MFGLLARRRKIAAPSTPRFARPGLECLETRDCPSTLTVSLTYGPQHQVVLQGRLSCAANVANQAVTFSGVVSGTAYTDTKGNFSATLVAQSLGNAMAQTADGLSNVAQVAVSNVAPVIQNFFGSCSAANFWTFSGTVVDEYAAGLIVKFAGSVNSMYGMTTTVQPHGTFSYTKQLANTSNDNGVVTAQVTDWWGVASDPASSYVSQTNVWD
jgi:hypothetical protein